MSTFRKLAAALALLAIAIALPGCKRAQDAVVNAAIERATGVKVDKSGDKVTIRTDKGEVRVAAASEGGSVALPVGFPTDVYLPAKHKVASAMDMAGMQMITLVTPIAPAATFAEADRAMQGKGWKRDMAMQSDDGSTLVFSRDKHQVFYQISKDDAGGSEIAVRTGTAE